MASPACWLRRLASCLPLLLMLAAPARAAEFFYMDRDPISNDYVGPVGSLVLSGEIVSGDYDRMLERIAADPSRFLAEDRIIVASDDGDVTEAVRIARFLRSALTEVTVGPLTGRCSGPCALIYLAAARRGSDGQDLLGLYVPPLDEVAILALRSFLDESQVPADVEALVLGHTRDDVYWLTSSEEQALGPRSPAFEQELAQQCGWSEELEHAVYQGERPLDDLKAVWACRDRLIQPAVRHTLCLALKEHAAARRDAAPQAGAPAKSAKSAKLAKSAKSADAPAAGKSHSKKPAAAQQDECSDLKL